MSEYDENAATAATTSGGWEPDWVTQVEVKPRLLVTGRITGLGELKETGKDGKGDYYKIPINVQSTRGSSPDPKPALMFRTEMFSTQFSSDKHYGISVDRSFEAVPPYNFIPRGKRNQITQAESFASVYRMNMIPKMKKQGDRIIITGNTPLSCIFGADLAGVDMLKDFIYILNNGETETGDLGITCPTADSIYAALKSYVSSKQHNEMVYELSQQKDQDGDPTDYYQVAKYWGLLTKDLYDYLKNRVAGTEGLPLDKQLRLKFRV